MTASAENANEYAQPEVDETSKAGKTSKREETPQAEQCSNDDETSQNEDTPKNEPDSESEQEEEDAGPESAAKRKAKQRRRDGRKGRKELTVVAPKDKDARRLVTECARIIFDKEIRAAMWLAVRDHELVLLGQKVDRLNGIRRLLVKWLLG